MITMWNDQLAQRFPTANHRNCVQARRHQRGFGLVAYDPPRCLDYHCTECGQASNVLGQHHCTAKEDA